MPPNGVVDFYSPYVITGFNVGTGMVVTSGAGDADATALVAADEVLVNVFFN